jgi:hypothetical protein
VVAAALAARRNEKSTSPCRATSCTIGHKRPKQRQRRPSRTAPEAQKPRVSGRFQISGRPDLNRGPHRPELWAKSTPPTENPCQSRCCSCCPRPLRTSVLRSIPGVSAGRSVPWQMTRTPHAGSHVISPARCAAAAMNGSSLADIKRPAKPATQGRREILVGMSTIPHDRRSITEAGS